MQQHQSQPVFTASPTATRNVVPRSPSARPMLPPRNVTSATFEETYVQFILYCNPAVPPDTDTAALRDAFQTPPKSGGKTFNTFHLFELIKQLEAKELKTWAELALKLGVEPPDQDKGQSSQKIQQYAVRLKRWMHSMHVDAYFEYLLDRPNSYWTDIPTDSNPVSEAGRDGVAAEDDMALRSLLPHIRPRRGRRKPEDDDPSKSPSQRPSMEPPPIGDDFSAVRADPTGAWSAHPDGRGSVFLFPVSDPLRIGTGMGQPSGPPWANNSDTLQTPLTAYPHSAITPSTRQAFWADEPKSAISPSKARMNKRHGAKVVSSAWRSGLGGTGKTRGRPRINRENQDGPFSAFPTTEVPTFKIPPPVQSQKNGTARPNILGSAPPLLTLVTSPVSIQPPTTSTPTTPVVNSPTPTSGSGSQNPRPAKRSRLSLQVPERVGGEVRLATPPPVVMVNGQATLTAASNGTAKPPAHSMNSSNGGGPLPLQPQLDYLGHRTMMPPQEPQQAQSPMVLPPTAGSSTTTTSASTNGWGPTPSSTTGPVPPPPPPPNQEQQPTGIRFEDPSDRTNVDALEGFFAHEVLIADWFDAAGNPIPSCEPDEAWALIGTVMESLLRTAATKDAFLINLAALAGGKLLMSTTKLRVMRLEEGADQNRYRCNWELRLGDIKGTYSMEETVLHTKWKKEKEKKKDEAEGAESQEKDAGFWQKKYIEMCAAAKKQDEEVADMRLKIMQALRVERDSI